MRNQITIPADVYDAIEFSALVFGGIGAGATYDYGNDDEAPFCAIGHLIFVGALGRMKGRALSAVRNDDAVRAVNARKGKSKARDARVTFREWCKEYPAVRGETA